MLSNLIARMGAIVPEPFVAPVPNAEVVDVFTFQQGVPFWFELREPRQGWWEIEPLSRGKAEIREQAQAGDIIAYLSELPGFYVIVLFRLAEETWLCIPYNDSDAAQRGWPDGEPRALHLVRDRLSPFDLVVGRMGGALLYDRIADRFGGAIFSEFVKEFVEEAQAGKVYDGDHNWRNALRIVLQRRRELEEEERRQAVEEQRKTVEGEMRWLLGFMDADLLSWTESGEGYQVRWAYGGEEHTMHIRRDMRVASAGFCMAGTDSRQNLSSIVAVMERTRGRRHYG